MIDITPLEILDILNKTYTKLSSFNYIGDNRLFRTLFYFYLSPKELIITHRLCKRSIELLMIKIELYFKDHNPPHFHAIYGEYNALFNLETLEIIEGDLPCREQQKW